jgi:hypothetical protein
MPTTESTKVILKSNESWDLWLHIKASTADRVWKYCDPYVKKEDLPKLVEPVEPVYSDIKVITSAVIPAVVSSSGSVETPAQGGDIIRPTVYSDLSTDEKAEYQEKRGRFRTLEKDYNKKVDALADVIKDIQTSIVENWIHLLIGQTTAYDMLCILREQFGPTDLVRENEIVIQWNTLKEGITKTTDMDEWLNKWIVLYRRGVKLGVADIVGNNRMRPVLAFVNTTNNICPSWSSIQRTKIADTEYQTDFVGIIGNFRNYWRNERTLPKPRGRHGAFAVAGHSDEESPSPTLNGKDKDGKRKSCLCGGEHPWSRCWYIIEEIRPADFKIHKQTMDSVNEKIKSSKNVRNVVKKLRLQAVGRQEMDRRSEKAGTSKEAKDGSSMPSQS